MSQKKSKEPDASRLSLRRSILIWVAGAMLGWVVAFVGIYSFLRFTNAEGPDHSMVASDTDAKKLSDIAPAAGPSHSKTADGVENENDNEKTIEK